jgi:hypothetical protein
MGALLLMIHLLDGAVCKNCKPRMQAEEPLLSWTSSDITLDHGLGLMAPVSVDRNIFLSKAFMNSMRPSNNKPYFYRAKGDFEGDHVTITTLITSNCFGVFPRLVEKYNGRSIYRFCVSQLIYFLFDTILLYLLSAAYLDFSSGAVLESM